MTSSTIVVHVWRPDDQHIGHCAVDIKKKREKTYISWWPEETCSATKPRSKTAPSPSIQQDIEGEGDRQPHSYVIHIPDQASDAIKSWWAGFKDQADYYQLISNNCSTVAYYALEKAFPFLGVFNDEVTVWVPTAVEMIAKDLSAGKRSFDAARIKEIRETAIAEAKRIAVDGLKGGFRVEGK